MKTKEKRFQELEAKIRELEGIVTGFRGRMLALAQAGQNLAGLHALNQPIIDRLIRIAIYNEKKHGIVFESVLEGYSQKTVQDYITRTGKAFTERVRVRSEQTGSVVSDHGISGSVVHRSEADRANLPSNEIDGEQGSCAVASGVPALRLVNETSH